MRFRSPPFRWVLVAMVCCCATLIESTHPTTCCTVEATSTSPSSPSLGDGVVAALTASCHGALDMSVDRRRWGRTLRIVVCGSQSEVSTCVEDLHRSRLVVQRQVQLEAACSHTVHRLFQAESAINATNTTSAPGPTPMNTSAPNHTTVTPVSSTTASPDSPNTTTGASTSPQPNTTTVAPTTIAPAPTTTGAPVANKSSSRSRTVSVSRMSGTTSPTRPTATLFDTATSSETRSGRSRSSSQATLTLAASRSATASSSPTSLTVSAPPTPTTTMTPSRPLTETRTPPMSRSHSETWTHPASVSKSLPKSVSAMLTRSVTPSPSVNTPSAAPSRSTSISGSLSTSPSGSKSLGSACRGVPTTRSGILHVLVGAPMSLTVISVDCDRFVAANVSLAATSTNELDSLAPAYGVTVTPIDGSTSAVRVILPRGVVQLGCFELQLLAMRFDLSKWHLCVHRAVAALRADPLGSSAVWQQGVATLNTLKVSVDAGSSTGIVAPSASWACSGSGARCPRGSGEFEVRGAGEVDAVGTASMAASSAFDLTSDVAVSFRSSTTSQLPDVCGIACGDDTLRPHGNGSAVFRVCRLASPLAYNATVQWSVADSSAALSQATSPIVQVARQPSIASRLAVSASVGSRTVCEASLTLQRFSGPAAVAQALPSASGPFTVSAAVHQLTTDSGVVGAAANLNQTQFGAVVAVRFNVSLGIARLVEQRSVLNLQVELRWFDVDDAPITPWLAVSPTTSHGSLLNTSGSDGGLLCVAHVPTVRPEGARFLRVRGVQAEPSLLQVAFESQPSRRVSVLNLNTTNTTAAGKSAMLVSAFATGNVDEISLLLTDIDRLALRGLAIKLVSDLTAMLVANSSESGCSGVTRVAQHVYSSTSAAEASTSDTVTFEGLYRLVQLMSDHVECHADLVNASQRTPLQSEPRDWVVGLLVSEATRASATESLPPRETGAHSACLTLRQEVGSFCALAAVATSMPTAESTPQFGQTGLSARRNCATGVHLIRGAVGHRPIISGADVLEQQTVVRRVNGSQWRVANATAVGLTAVWRSANINDADGCLHLEAAIELSTLLPAGGYVQDRSQDTPPEAMTMPPSPTYTALACVSYNATAGWWQEGAQLARLLNGTHAACDIVTTGALWTAMAMPLPWPARDPTRSPSKSTSPGTHSTSVTVGVAASNDISTSRTTSQHMVVQGSHSRSFSRTMRASPSHEEPDTPAPPNTTSAPLSPSTLSAADDSSGDTQTIIGAAVAAAVVIAVVVAVAFIVVARRSKAKSRTREVEHYFVEDGHELHEMYDEIMRSAAGFSDPSSQACQVETSADGSKVVRVRAPTRSRAEVLAEL